MPFDQGAADELDGKDIGPSSVSTGDLTYSDVLTDAAGYDIYGTFLFEALLSYTIASNGDVDVTRDGAIRLRVNGDASAVYANRAYNERVAWDPTVSRTVRFHLDNITIDNNSFARFELGFHSNPDGIGASDGDKIYARVDGNGDIYAITGNDGSNNFAGDTTQDNSFASSLNYIELQWDGTELTVEASDGTTTVTTSSSTNYPNEDVHLRVGAVDNDGSNALNADADVTKITEE